MPRTSKNTVEYTVNGVTYIAKFEHEHGTDEVPLKPLRGEKTGDELLLRHITTCRIYKKGDSSRSVRGVALCSLFDTYDWRVGIKKSFQRALAKMRLTPKMPSTATHHIIATPDEVLYGLHMQAFFKEMRVKDYTSTPPSPAPAEMGKVIGSIIPASVEPQMFLAPREFRNGTYHMGAD